MAFLGMSSTVSIIPARNSRSFGLHGANVTPQLPKSAVVTPCQDTGVNSGSQPAWASKWVCKSTNPGVIALPLAFISWCPSPSTFPTAAILSPSIATSPKYGSVPVPSTIRPSRMIKSCAISIAPRCIAFPYDATDRPQVSITRKIGAGRFWRSVFDHSIGAPGCLNRGWRETPDASDREMLMETHSGSRRQFGCGQNS